MAKLQNAQAIALIKLMLNGESNEELATKFNLHPRYVSLIRGRKRWVSLWDDFFPNVVPPKSAKPKPAIINAASRIDTDTQVTIIRRIHLGCKLRDLAEEYGLDPSSLSRIKNERTWKYAHNKLKQINAQRLSKTS
jgi:DNA-binding Xre family transcriptional regulator